MAYSEEFLESIQTIAGAAGACALEDNDLDPLGAYIRGHDRAQGWKLREYVIYEWGYDARAGLWPKRIYFRDVPWSIAYPGDPPCGSGPETILLERCKRDTPGAYPVTVIDL